MAWIFLNDAFLSIVRDPNSPDDLLVRARAKGDIERLFPKATVIKLPNRDYAYRAYIAEDTVAEVIAKRLLFTDYGNFKGSVKEHDRHMAYLNVWSAMMRFQIERAQGERPEPDLFEFAEDVEDTPHAWPKGSQNRGKGKPRRR